MRNESETAVLQTVETLFRVGTTSNLTDSDLLDRFVSSEGELASAAFEVIVSRHGPMVFDHQCRRGGNYAALAAVEEPRPCMLINRNDN